MNKFIPVMLGLALLTGSMAMAAPTVSKTHHRSAVKKTIKKAPAKKASSKLVSKK